MKFVKEHWIFIALVAGVVLVCLFALTSCASSETRERYEAKKQEVADLERAAGEARARLELSPSAEAQAEFDRVQAELSIARADLESLKAKRSEEAAESRAEWFAMGSQILGLILGALGIGAPALASRKAVTA